MKKFVLSVAVLAACAAANAGTASAPFQATVNFTSSCVIASATPPALSFGSYTAFGLAVTASPVTLSLNCSRGTTISLFSFVTPATTNGLFPVNNLRYTVSLTYAGVASAPGSFATTSQPGTPEVHDFDIGGTLPSQAGKSNSAVATSETVTRLVKIDF